MKNRDKKDDDVKDRQQLLDEYKEKEERNKIIRKIQRDLAIKFDFIKKLEVDNQKSETKFREEKNLAANKNLKKDKVSEINLNNIDNLFKTFT